MMVMVVILHRHRSVDMRKYDDKHEHLSNQTLRSTHTASEPLDSLDWTLIQRLDNH